MSKLNLKLIDSPLLQILLQGLEYVVTEVDQNCLILADNAEHAAWLSSPGILAVLYPALRKENEGIRNISVVFGAIYDYVKTSDLTIISSSRLHEETN